MLTIFSKRLMPIFFGEIRSSSAIKILSHFKCFKRKNNDVICILIQFNAHTTHNISTWNGFAPKTPKKLPK
ncbi:hypothetical protein DERF_014935 [Dermatophagoides farinae]|uniref:Uncharacterized protein n=1 Tax=Dermatophagoides farinae TaxID=6954 RepID=A0A922KU19_DERFA|nr:hypothetical protein DERF_014935 [Dermatophagoides farinae]